MKIALAGIGKSALDQHVPVLAASPDWNLAATVSRHAPPSPRGGSSSRKGGCADRPGRRHRLGCRDAGGRGGRECRIVELQGTTGSSPAIDHKKGFENIIAGHVNLGIVQSHTGDFIRSLGKEVRESFLQFESGGKDICALYAHNDDMAVGAMQAIREAGLKPGQDILIVSIDGVPDILKAMADGEANATVGLTPNMAGPAFDALEAFRADGTGRRSSSRPNRLCSPRRMPPPASMRPTRVWAADAIGPGRARPGPKGCRRCCCPSAR